VSNVPVSEPLNLSPERLEAVSQVCRQFSFRLLTRAVRCYQRLRPNRFYSNFRSRRYPLRSWRYEMTAAVMGFDPRAKRFHVRKTHPDIPNDPLWADNPMLLAEAVGLGTADLSRIEVVGVPIKDAVFDFEAARTGKRA